MENAEKFSKTIDDDALDKVAGGNAKEWRKDINFLNAIGLRLSRDGINDSDITNAWKRVGIVAVVFDNQENDYGLPGRSREAPPKSITRQEAMILAMRRTKRVVDLDEYN